jgi:hypothetical protein
VKELRFAVASWGQPLWFPQGGHKGCPYKAILSQLRSLSAQQAAEPLWDLDLRRL